MTGRPRSFDKDAALAIAMEQFWREGYDETTVSKLTQLIGVSPPSLYAAFGDKDQLFAAAAACYVDRVSEQADRSLAKTTAREGLSELMRLTAAAHTDPATPPGCFLLSDPRLAEQRSFLRQKFADRLERGLREGDVPPGTDPELLASFLMAVLGGMSTRARDGGDATEIAGIAAIAEAALPPVARP